MISSQLYPYALADFVCARLRVSPFKYYCDLLFSVMREEKSYDFIPNFTVGTRWSFQLHHLRGAFLLACPCSQHWELNPGARGILLCHYQAADILRVVGIGRNQYIDLMNQCKAKKLLWRINKASCSAAPRLPTVSTVVVRNVGYSGSSRHNICTSCMPAGHCKGSSAHRAAGAAR